MAQAENKIQLECLKYLRKKRVFCWRNGNHAVWDAKNNLYRKNEYAMLGVADILCVDKTGRLIAIEIKTKTGRLSPDQHFFCDRLTSRGGEYHVVRSLKDIQELDPLW